MSAAHEMSTHLAATRPFAGAGLKHEHAPDIFESSHCIDFFEIHAENYMGAGGPPHHLLRQIRSDYPVSIHGVGLSIGGAEPLDREHLGRLKTLTDRYQPALFSEHLAWSTHDGVFLNDLLPLPYNCASLQRVCEHIDQVQEALGRRMLLENPSTYVRLDSSSMSETEFLREVSRRTGCGLLLDVNNVCVSATNHGFDPVAYIAEFPIGSVGEIHLAGHATDSDRTGRPLLIDSHGTQVAEVVWSLFVQAVAHTGPVPTLIEWDNDVPSFPVLSGEVARARNALAQEIARYRPLLAA